ncbi:NAD(P)H-dependent oxidoreductase subunit E [Sedimenticola sp.]|uniref:NAD(P)H-dependent oxidoreductase subunit E n=1 Tax=Sedimenticola sp. TaxID=1940285 RepID=UPI003D11D914
MAQDNAQQKNPLMNTRWESDPAHLLQILNDLQQALRYIPDDAIDHLAESLKLSKAFILGVIDFYSFLHRTPRGEFDVLFSDNITDQMQGSRLLAELLSRRLQVEIGSTRPDQRVSLGFTSCIGMGDQGPAALINGRTVTRLSAERIEQLAELIEQAVPLDQWPTALFQVGTEVKRRDIVLDTPYTAGAALQSFLQTDRDTILDRLEQAGLRGCGGAGFSTAKKWRFCAAAKAAEHYVVCNADEGEPGTFKDRYLLQTHADRVFEGMTLCAAVIGARRGFLYLRAEYRYLLEPLQQILQQRRHNHLLGDHILDQAGFDFDITIHLGAGAYICGEESALIESLEGKRGIPRNRPPFPVTEGYRGMPTVVNNVETLANAAMIAQQGAKWFHSVGTEQSPGTKLLSISGDCAQPGIYEFPFGTSISDILTACQAQNTQAVQIGGAAGRLIPPTEFNRTLGFEDLSTGGSFMIFNQSRELLNAIDNFSRFFSHESCGFCTPCRVGTSLMVKQLSKVMVGHATRKDLDELGILGNLMQQASHCGLGQTAANPVLDGLEKFPGIFQSRLRSTSFEPAFDLDASLEEARTLTGRNDPGAHLEGGGV